MKKEWEEVFITLLKGNKFLKYLNISKANNKYLKSYDNSKPSKYIRYLDANNLYGWAMSHYLPNSKFKWLNKKEIDKFDINLIKKIV